MGEKKKNGRTGALNFIHGKTSLITVYTHGLYSHQDKQKYQKQQKYLTITRTKWEEIKRVQQKVHSVKLQERWTVTGGVNSVVG